MATLDIGSPKKRGRHSPLVKRLSLRRAMKEGPNKPKPGHETTTV